MKGVIMLTFDFPEGKVPKPSSLLAVASRLGDRLEGQGVTTYIAVSPLAEELLAHVQDAKPAHWVAE